MRASSARSYVYPFLERQNAKENLVILVGHQAIGIVWGEDDMDGNATATGVRFAKTPVENGTIDSPIWEVAATKEVIVASGAIGVRRVPLLTKPVAERDDFSPPYY